MSQDTKTPGSIIWPSEKFVHERIAQLMIDIGMPNDTPLWNAFSQFETDLRSRVEVAPASTQPDRGAAWESDLHKSTDAKRVMMSAFAFCPSDLAHPQKMAWIGDFFIKHYVAAASPASQPVAPEAAQAGTCSVCTNLEAQLRSVVHQRDAAISAHAQQEAAPDGYVLVPKVPTAPMLTAIWNRMYYATAPAELDEAYAAMLAVAHAAVAPSDAKDAARYRFLRKHQVRTMPETVQPYVRMENLDRAIDAAMAAVGAAGQEGG